ncbi:MAG: right-handed parallel beta-helix repeat-containing protein [Verrucomicrobiota bacterium]
MTIRSLILIMLGLSAHVSNAELINVADHGIKPGDDASLALYQLIDSIADKKDVTLFFPKGQYEFYPENALEIYRAVTNHDNSLKRIAFPLHGHKNITIDGNESTFMFHGRMSPFSVVDAENVTLKNFSIDWARSFHDELPVVESNKAEGYVVVEVDPERYPHEIKNRKLHSIKYNWKDDMGSQIVFDPETRSPIYDTKAYNVAFWNDYTATWQGDRRVKIESKFSREPPPVGSVLISYGTHPTSRLCPAIHLDGSKNIKIEGVTVYAAGGMGIIAERCEDIHVDRMTVTSTEDRLISTRADATHFLGCKGTIMVENSLFEHMLDDAINVHGAYIKVVEYMGDKKFLCEISHFQQWGLIFAEQGDKVALLSRKNILPFYETEVTATEILNEHRVIVTVNNVPDKLPEGPLSMENLTWNPDLIFRKNTIRENRARGLLITTKGKALVEDNYIAPQMHGILIEGDNNNWYESGAVKEVIIRNNQFVNVGFEGGTRYPLYAAPLLREEQHYGDGHYHSNITFENNTLKSFNGHLVHAFSVSGLKIHNNTIEFSKDYPKIDEFPSIDLVYCDNVEIHNNQSKGFGKDMEIKASSDTTNVSSENNEGFK